MPVNRSTGSGGRILVVDDEAVICLSCEEVLTREGYQVVCRRDASDGLAEALTGNYDVVLLDLIMPEIQGLDVLARIREAGVSAEIVIVTGYATVQTAVEAMKLGAVDYLCKPFTPDELRMTVSKVMERSALIRENSELRKKLVGQQGFEGIIGESREMERVYSLIQRVAPTDGSVLISGESGTGKEMVARAIHRLSPREQNKFMACDCSALAPTLLESELFGHAKGSFSGAHADKTGFFEAADRGTLFLDEVGNINLETQGKLLRALETRQVKRVGETVERSVDIRLIAATNSNLQEMVREGKFREDLFYRLNVVPIRLPPLRERMGDIPRLIMFFLARFQGARPQVTVRGFAPEAMRILENYGWPGNVRELKNIVERLAILGEAECIEPGHLPDELVRAAGRGGRMVSEIPADWESFRILKKRVRETAVEDLERNFVRQALVRAGGNISLAARQTGLQRTHFHSLMRRYSLNAHTE